MNADVSVIIPALNEERTIADVLDRVLALPLNLQVIVVDDGSTDGTSQALKAYADRILVLRNEVRGGKGAAIKRALAVATGSATIVQDADLEYRPEEIPMLVDPILRGQATVVYGTRFSGGLVKGMALPNKVVNLLLALSVRLIYGFRITDEATCYKAFKTSLLKEMKLDCVRFEFCPEVTGKALRMGEAIQEIPIHYEPRGKNAGKKIRWTDAPEAFWTLWKYRRWRP